MKIVIGKLKEMHEMPTKAKKTLLRWNQKYMNTNAKASRARVAS